MTAPRSSGRSPGRPGRPPKFERSPTPFGRWLDESGLSVEQVATRAGINARNVYRFRSGEKLPSLDVAERLIEISEGRLDFRSFRPD